MTRTTIVCIVVVLAAAVVFVVRRAERDPLAPVEPGASAVGAPDAGAEAGARPAPEHSAGHRVPIDARPSHDSSDGHVATQPAQPDATTFSVVVRTSDGRLVPGARIYARTGGAASLVATADASARAVFVLQGHGSQAYLWAAMSPYDPIPQTWQPGTATPTTLSLRVYPDLQLHVKTSDSSPLADVRGYAQYARSAFVEEPVLGEMLGSAVDEYALRHVSFTTDADGRVTLPNWDPNRESVFFCFSDDDRPIALVSATFEHAIVEDHLVGAVSADEQVLIARIGDPIRELDILVSGSVVGLESPRKGVLLSLRTDSGYGVALPLEWKSDTEFVARRTSEWSLWADACHLEVRVLDGGGVPGEVIRRQGPFYLQRLDGRIEGAVLDVRSR